MEKIVNVSHSGGSKGKSADLGNPAQRQSRSGSYSPGSAAVSDTHPSQSQKRHLEGVLNKYTNLLQGWQNRYFVLDPELGQLQYFINEHSKVQKPRGSLPLIGSSVAPSDEFPFMFTVCAANGDFFKLRASDVREQQIWMTQLQLCARRHSDGNAKADGVLLRDGRSSRAASCGLLSPSLLLLPLLLSVSGLLLLFLLLHFIHRPDPQLLPAPAPRSAELLHLRSETEPPAWDACLRHQHHPPQVPHRRPEGLQSKPCWTAPGQRVKPHLSWSWSHAPSPAHLLELIWAHLHLLIWSWKRVIFRLSVRDVAGASAVEKHPDIE